MEKLKIQINPNKKIDLNTKTINKHFSSQHFCFPNKKTKRKNDLYKHDKSQKSIHNYNDDGKIERKIIYVDLFEVRKKNY